MQSLSNLNEGLNPPCTYLVSECRALPDNQNCGVPMAITLKRLLDDEEKDVLERMGAAE